MPSINNQNLTAEIFGITGALLFLSSLAVALRIISRRLSSASFWWDDGTIIAALVYSTILSSLSELPRTLLIFGHPDIILWSHCLLLGPVYCRRSRPPYRSRGWACRVTHAHKILSGRPASSSSFSANRELILRFAVVYGNSNNVFQHISHLQDFPDTLILSDFWRRSMVSNVPHIRRNHGRLLFSCMSVCRHIRMQTRLFLLE